MTGTGEKGGLTRRGFLRGLAAGGISAALLGSLSAVGLAGEKREERADSSRAPVMGEPGYEQRIGELFSRAGG